MKIITNHFCNYNALDLLTKCHSMLIIKNSIVLYTANLSCIKGNFQVNRISIGWLFNLDSIVSASAT